MISELSLVLHKYKNKDIEREKMHELEVNERYNELVSKDNLAYAADRKQDLLEVGPEYNNKSFGLEVVDSTENKVDYLKEPQNEREMWLYYRTNQDFAIEENRLHYNEVSREIARDKAGFVLEEAKKEKETPPKQCSRDNSRKLSWQDVRNMDCEHIRWREDQFMPTDSSIRRYYRMKTYRYK